MGINGQECYSPSPDIKIKNQRIPTLKPTPIVTPPAALDSIYKTNGQPLMLLFNIQIALNSLLESCTERIPLSEHPKTFKEFLLRKLQPQKILVITKSAHANNQFGSYPRVETTNTPKIPTKLRQVSECKAVRIRPYLTQLTTPAREIE